MRQPFLPIAGDELPDGVLFVGHGTRDPRGREEFLELARLVGLALPKTPLEACFLELLKPTIAEGLSRLVEQIGRSAQRATGTTQRSAPRIVIVPLMLFAAGHVRRDIPRQVAHAIPDSSGIRVTYASHLGCHPRIVELSARRFAEAVIESPAIPPEAAGMVFVGRGNRDAEAQAELARLVALRVQATPVAWTEICYLAMARPTLTEGLELAAVRPGLPIVVQPHLLFQGMLAEELREAVSVRARQMPERGWRLAEPLGPDPLLAAAVVDRIREACAAVPEQGGERGGRVCVVAESAPGG